MTKIKDVEVYVQADHIDTNGLCVALLDAGMTFKDDLDSTNDGAYIRGTFTRKSFGWPEARELSAKIIAEIAESWPDAKVNKVSFGFNSMVFPVVGYPETAA